MIAPILMLSLFVLSSGIQGEVVLREAQIAFREGLRLANGPVARQRFADAAARYETLRAAGYCNADLYFNQGNAYFLAGDLPRALLSYHRGLRIAPDDGRLRGNIIAARQALGVPQGAQLRDRPGDGAFEFLGSIGALATALVIYTASWFVLVRALLVGRRLALLTGISGLIVAGTILGAWWHRDRSAQTALNSPLVIVAGESVTLRTGDGTTYPPRQPTHLQAGWEAECVTQRGKWLQVRLPNGEVGWLPADRVLVQ